MAGKLFFCNCPFSADVLPAFNVTTSCPVSSETGLFLQPAADRNSIPSALQAEKIRRPQVKRGFIPNEAADILFGGGIVDFVKAFVQNRLQRLQIKRLRPVKESRIHQPRSQVRQVCAGKLRESRMAIVLPIAVLTYRNFAFLNDESVKIIIIIA